MPALGRLAAVLLGLCAFLTAVPLGAQPGPRPLEVGAPLFYSAGNDVPFQPIVPPTEKHYTTAEVVEVAARRAAVAKREGLTSIEVYVKWSLCEPEPGRWDFSYYDIWEQAVKAAGIRWVPLLILGPSWATPSWFKNSGESVFARCLEHSQDTPTQSIWNPNLRPHATELLSQFAAHFRPELMESVMVGISGDFGESIYPCGGNHWTYLGDPYHVHAGYWCGDRHAVGDLQQKVEHAYGDIARLNAAWRTNLHSFQAVQPFLPSQAPSRRAALDLQRWYCASMTDYLDFWLQTARAALPRNRLVVSLGGDGSPFAGADFSAQAKAAALHGAGIRITNEASDYAGNFSITRQVATACRHYGTYFGIEPAGGVTDQGIVGRVYNATASGADELFTYDPEPAGERAQDYAALRPFLVKRDPLVDIGLFLSRTSWDLGRLQGFFESAQRLRGITDLDVADELLIADGHLQRLRALFWTAGPVVESMTANALESWVSAGGMLVVCGLDAIETVEGDTWPSQRLLPLAVLEHRHIPERYRADTGTPAGDTVLAGTWHGAESGLGLAPPDTTFRWSADGSAMELPLPPGDVFTVAVCVVGAGAHPTEQTLLVDGSETYRLAGPGRQIARFTIAAPQGVRKGSFRLQFGGPTRRASEADSRMIGMAVVWVGVGKGTLTAEALEGAPILGSLPGLTPERMAAEFTRRIDQGAAVFLPPADASWPTLARAVVDHPEAFLPGASAPYPPFESGTEGVYLTRLRDGGALLLNLAEQETHVTYAGRGATIPARAIGEVRVPG